MADPFIDHVDLLKYAPKLTNDVSDQDFIDSVNAAIRDAQDDIESEIRIRWFNERAQTTVKFIEANMDDEWDSSKLDPTQWGKCVIYRALSRYILPLHSQFDSDVDAFQNRMVFYENQYNEEIDRQFNLGIRYDIDDDDTFDEEEEVFESSTRWRIA